MQDPILVPGTVTSRVQERSVELTLAFNDCQQRLPDLCGQVMMVGSIT
jgi:hypothetical protein